MPSVCKRDFDVTVAASNRRVTVIAEFMKRSEGTSRPAALLRKGTVQIRQVGNNTRHARRGEQVIAGCTKADQKGNGTTWDMVRSRGTKSNEKGNLGNKGTAPPFFSLFAQLKPDLKVICRSFCKRREKEFHLLIISVSRLARSLNPVFGPPPSKYS